MVILANRLGVSLLILSFLSGSIARASSSSDWTRDARIMGLTSSVGLAGGVAAGALIWPISGSAKSVLWGGLGGLTLGLVFGVYHLTHKYDPNNPFYQRPDPVPPWQKSWKDPEATNRLDRGLDPPTLSFVFQF